MSFSDLQLPRSLAPAMASLLVCVAGLGCVVHPVDPEPQPAVAEKESGGGNAERFAHAPDRKPGESNRDPWWETFRDRNLDKLIEDALVGSPDLRAVGERIEQANARLVQAGSTLFPQVDGAGEFQRRWDVDGRRSDDSSIGLIYDWEIDAWGRIRSGQAARRREAEAAVDDWLAARLLLSSAVSEAWFELREQRGQLDLASEQIEVNQTLLDLTRLRFGQGQSSVVDVYQAQEQLESIQSLVPDIESRIEELNLVLDTLMGKMPGSTKPRHADGELNSPPSWPETGVPSDLLAERPDLRAQRARIIAVDHEVGEAIAERLPRFSIGGSLAAGGTPSIERLVGDAVVSAVGPVFDAGNRKAEVERRRSRVQEEIDIFTSLYLEAVRDVEVALVREDRLHERIQRQEAQLTTARKLLRESKNRYVLGATDYLPVLDAVTKVQELERDLLTSYRERLSARVSLHRALGGPMPIPPSTTLASQP
ncbi:MAG: efflux transporter outer membrane subunit [Verrucomicrobiae bacterium]|nr:efflux transporter outer membrane subunit [Verrucomicrobiae bacterium]